MADNKKILLSIITPRRVLYEKDIDMIIMHTTEGDIGVMAGHIPLTVALEYGLIKILDDDTELTAAVFGGFAEIGPKKVTLLSDAAEWPDEIDLHRAEEARERAERRIKQSQNNLELMRAELALRRALVRIELGNKTDK